jgi:DNA-binding NarL/FixJ family response regulator
MNDQVNDVNEMKDDVLPEREGDHGHSDLATDSVRGELVRSPGTSPDRRRLLTDRSNGDRPAVVQPLRLALVNDYEIIVRGLHAMLSPYHERVLIVEHEVGHIPTKTVDVALFDTFAGRRDALGRAAAMVDRGNARHVVLYTWDASADFLEAARATGVSAVVLKSATGADLVSALERVAAGEQLGLEHVTRSPSGEQAEALSVREREVLAMLALGSTNAQIAGELYLSVDTVKTYVRRVFQKLGVHNRTQAAMMAQRYDLGPPPARLERIRSSPGEPGAG